MHSGVSIADVDGKSATEGRSFLLRIGAWLVLCGIELVLMSVLHKMPAGTPYWLNPFSYFRNFGLVGIAGFAAFVLISWHRRSEILAEWRTAQRHHRHGVAIGVHVVLFAALLAATFGMRHVASAGQTVAMTTLVGYGLLVLATVVSLLRVDVPLRALISIAISHPAYLAGALAAGAAARLAAFLAQTGWSPLASATLDVSRTILELYEADVAVDLLERSVRVGQFKAIIGDACSGFEGIALVCVFLTTYLWCFRGQLRFPRAYLLFPIGIAVIWLANALRIALLVSLGAHVAPEVAVQGFHSQAGWIFFLLVTIGLMVVAQTTEFVAKPTGSSGPPLAISATVAGAPSADRIMLAFLAPFMALMAASILLMAIAPIDRPLYGIKVAAVALALWLFRDVYRGLGRAVPFEAIFAGLLVGFAWIATDPDPAAGQDLGNWLDQQGPWLASVWIALRVAGSVITVPIAEELAFRGLLHRWIVSRDFATVPFERYSLAAFVVSSALFGLLHERWLAGALAGAVFALVMYRSRSIAAPIAAHMAANAIICAWALIFGQWSLL